MRCVRVLTVIGVCLAAAVPVAAQSPVSPPAAETAQQALRDELDRLRREFEVIRKQYDERLLALEQRVSELGQGPSAPSGTAGTASATGTTGTIGTAGTQDPVPAPQTPAAAPPQSSKVFNPDISVIGNFLGVAGKNDQSTQPAMQMSEVEAAFQAIVDPYARADFFLAASPEGLEVEEGYITFTSLPARLLLKAGKMRAQFGKVNTLHTHAMPTADRPLVTENLVGGEEGLSDAGLSLSHLVNNPHLFLELTGEVYGGTSAVFQSQQRSDLTYVGRVRAFRDLTEATNIDLGVSFATGATNIPSALPTGGSAGLDKQLFGIDASFRYRPLRRAIYQRLNVRTELIWSRQDTGDDLRESAFGFYTLGDYQFARRWYIGGRVDRSGRTLDASAIDTGGSVFLTFWPTEFSQVRGQYRRINFAEGTNANEFLFQVNFSIGAHGAHVF